MNKINIPETVSLNCLFCGSSDFIVEKDNNESIKEQKMYECSSCGKLNSFEGMMEVCKENVANDLKKEIENYAKNIFKDRK